jgi:hypothetical protein
MATVDSYWPGSVAERMGDLVECAELIEDGHGRQLLARVSGGEDGETNSRTHVNTPHHP